MLRRASRLTVLLVVLIATALTPRQGSAAGGGPLPAGAANPARHPAATGRPPTAGPAAAGAPWQAPPRLRSVGGGGAAAAGTARAVARDEASLPLAFEPNEGQTDPSVSFLAHGQGYTAFLTQDGVTLALAPPGPPAQALPGSAPAPRPTPAPAPGVRIAFQGASAQAQPVAQDPLPGTVNYLVGKDPSKWHTGIPTYGQVSYPAVYPGVDLVYHGQGNQVAFDFVVHPGTQASAIRLQLAGVDGAAPNSAGDLVIGAAGRALRALQPTAYQDIAGQRHPVGAHYRLLGGDAVGLTLDAYDASQPVTIDPVLVYSSYLGGSGADSGQAIAVDSSGAAYLAGVTTSYDFPVVNPEQGQNNPGAGYVAAFVSKFNPAGNALVYSTYLGGSGTDEGFGIAVDASGAAYVTGYTDSPDFPVVGAYQGTLQGGYDAFVSKLSASGSSLVYSTYLGGTGGAGEQQGNGIAVDGSGDAYVTGYTDATNFPLLHAEQGTEAGSYDAFVSELNPAGSALVYSTFLGGNNDDEAQGITVDGSGAAYIAGYTTSTTLPISPTYAVVQGSPGGGYDAFVSKLSAGGTSLAYSTYLGGSESDGAYGIAVDAAGTAYVTGWTASANFPTQDALQGSNHGGANGCDAFVASIDAQGTALGYSTYLGGSGDDYGEAIAAASGGEVWVTGLTASTNFPTVQPQQGSNGGGEDAFVSQVRGDGQALLYSSYLGGSGNDLGLGVAVDGSGAPYVTGVTASLNFPKLNPEQGSNAGGDDAFVSKFAGPSCVVGTAPASSGTVPWHPHYAARITSLLGLSVDLADGHADLSAADLAVAGRGPDLVVQHTWDSTLALGCTASSNGSGWRSDLTPSMSGAPGSTVVYEDATGARWTFPYVSGAYQTPAGLPYSLTANGSGYTLSNILTGEKLTFDSQGRYTQDTDAYGNYNALAQSGGGAPTSETNHGSGRALTMTYLNGLLNDIQSPIYHGSGPTAMDGQHAVFGYDGQELTGLTWGGQTTDAQSAHFGYTGDLLTSVTTPMTISGTLAVTREWTLGYDSSNRLVSITSPISGTAGPGATPAYTTLFTYYSGSTVVRAGYGSGHVINTTYTLDAAGRATAVMDGLSHFNHYTYDADNDVTSSKDGNNNVTNYYYQYVGPLGTGGLDSTGQVTETVLPAIHPGYPGGTLTAPTTHDVYDPTSHDLTEQYDNAGAYSFYTYNPYHDIVSTAVLTGTTTNGGTTTYSWRGSYSCYDSNGERTGFVDGRGVPLGTTTSPVAPTITRTCPATGSYARTWSYDGQGNLASASTPPIITSACPSSPCAAVTHYTYDGDGNLATMQSANNANVPQNVSVYGYDHLGRLNSGKQPPISIVNPPLGKTTAIPLGTIKFDGDGNVATQEDANGTDTFYSYDPQGRMVSIQQPLSLRTEQDPEAVAQTALTINTYTATNLQSVQDPQGNVTQYTYDAANRLITAVNAAGQEVTYGYDAADNLTSITVGNPANPSSTIARTPDALNRVYTQTVNGPGLGAALKTTYSYDLHGHLVRQQDPNNDTSFAGYDLADELVSQELDPGAPNVPAGTHQETFAYDLAGNRVGSVDFRGGTTTMTMDGDNRQTGQTDNYPGVPTISTTAQLDPDGNLVAQTQTINGQTHSFSASLNPADWPQNATNDGLSSQATGAGAGDVLTQTIQNNAGVVAYNIDQVGRDNQIGVTSMGSTTPLSTTFTFNNNEQLTGELLPNNVEQDAGYDAANRLSSLTAVNNANHALLNNTYQYGYDLLGLTDAITTTVQGVPSTQTLTHDAAGRLTGASGGSSTGVWAYDGRGNLASATFDGAATGYAYNPTNPEEVASATTGSTAVNYSYDGDGNATTATTGTTIFTSQAPAGTYSGAEELGVKFQSTQAGSIAGLRYYRNPGETGAHTGHLWSVSGTLLGSVSFTNEGVGGWQTAFFASPVAISAGTTYVASYNANAEFSATLGGIATSVANGPLSTIVGSNGVYSTSPGSFPSTGTSGNNYFADVVFEAQADGVLAEQLGYDAQSRLSQITLGVPVTETVSLAYDAFGQRATYTVTPTGHPASLSETFKYQGDELAQVAFSGSSVTTPYTDTYLYTQDGVPLELLRQSQGAGTATPYWYVVDGQGNVVALTTQSGTVVNSYRYDQWGRPISVSESAPQQLRYAGYWYDNELTWYWLSVRPYDPALKRFLQPDPSELEGLFNYVYAGDNPADRIDPTGLIAMPPQTGCLLTTSNNIECNIQVNSAQWNREKGNGATPITSIDGASLADLLPVLCGHISGVCLISLHAYRGPGMAARAALDCGGGFFVGGLCNFVGAIAGAAGTVVTYVADGAVFLCDMSICGDLTTIRNGPWYMKILATGDILLTFVPAADAAKAGELAAKLGLDFAEHVSAPEAEKLAARLADTLATACKSMCFPAETLVATARGRIRIDHIHVGDRVLTADPKTGKLETEHVEAVRHDPPTWVMAIGLADGSTIEVTPEHPFWVDRGVNFAGPGWLQAGNLHVGDQLRTTGNVEATVVALRYRVAKVAVYTLTLGDNHDFFVGTAQVLVHNANCSEQIGQWIAGGHAWDQHAAEFPWIKSRSDFGYFIEGIMEHPSAMKALSNGRTAYWDNATGTLVIVDPKHPDLGTVFRPSRGRAYYNNLH